MNFNNTVYEIVREDLTELKEQARTMTIKELASANGTSYSKMACVLRLGGIKAKRPELPPRVRKAKVKVELPKKDHTISMWASSFNHGRIRYVYYDMLRRCGKPDDRNYKAYGGRGITVCEEWKKDCCNFYKWAKESGYAEGLQLDRKDNNKGYSPDNCHWVTPLDNSYNKCNNRQITFNGETHNLRDWSRITGISKYILADRIYKYKWDVERALTEKPRAHRV